MLLGRSGYFWLSDAVNTVKDSVSKGHITWKSRIDIHSLLPCVRVITQSIHC